MVGGWLVTRGGLVGYTWRCGGEVKPGVMSESTHNGVGEGTLPPERKCWERSRFGGEDHEYELGGAGFEVPFKRPEGDPEM